MGVGSVQAAGGDHQSDGVGAQYPDSGFPGRFTNGIHQGLAGFTVSTRHATGHNDRSAHPGLPQPLDGLGHGIRRRTDDCQVRGKFHFRDFLDAGHPVHVVVIVLVHHQ